MGDIRNYIRKDGSKAFNARVRVRGYPTASKSFDRLTDAKRWAEQTKREIIEGKYFATAEGKKHTLREAINRYLNDSANRQIKTWKEHGFMLRQFDNLLGHKLLSDITPAVLYECRGQIAQRVTHLGKNVSKSRMNRYFSALSRLFQVAVEQWEWMESNPCRRMRRQPEPKSPGRCITDDELRRVREYCRLNPTEPISIIVILALTTGMRRGELQTLKWKDLDLKDGTALLQTTKNNESRSVPITEPALGMLRQHAIVRHIGTDWVFPQTTTGNLSKPIRINALWRRFKGAIGLENFRFHDLRHSCASFLARNGVDARTIAEILGHKTLAMAMRYSHLSTESLRPALESTNRMIYGS